MTKTINLYTDGSCLGNPGPGGWGYVLEWGDYRIFGGDGMTNTTNNRQELYAVIHGLEQIKRRDRPVVVYCDSDYVVKGVSQWLDKWKARGWRNANNKPVKNRDLWEHLDQLLGEFDDVRFVWIKAHNGNQWNEYADELARAAAEMAKNAVLTAA